MGVFAYKNSGVHNVTNSFSFQRLISHSLLRRIIHRKDLTTIFDKKVEKSLKVFFFEIKRKRYLDSTLDHKIAFFSNITRFKKLPCF
jgi:hypothetical protein